MPYKDNKDKLNYIDQQMPTYSRDDVVGYRQRPMKKKKIKEKRRVTVAQSRKTEKKKCNVVCKKQKKLKNIYYACEEGKEK